MTVSVIILVYKVAPFIRQCLTSVFDQSYTDLEVIVVDDASPDESMSIIKSLLSERPELNQKIRIIRNTANQGVTYSRQRGIHEATGDYVIFVDGDDFLGDNYIESLVSVAKTEACDIVIAGHTLYYKDHFLLREPKICREDCLRPQLLIGKLFSGELHASLCTKLVKRSLYINHITAVPTVELGDDLIVAYKLFYFAHKVVAVSDNSYYYRYTAVTGATSKKCSLVSDLAIVNDVQTFFSTHTWPTGAQQSLKWFRVGRVGKALLYDTLNYDEQQVLKELSGFTSRDVISHPKIGLHYKLIVLFYLYDFNAGIRLLRKLKGLRR